MNIRRRSKIRDMLEQLMPFDEYLMGDESPPEKGSSLVAFLRYWQEDPTFLEVFERLWNRLLSPDLASERLEPKKAIRVFTEEEELLLATEARGYILRLRAAGVLSTEQLETVIERAFECWAEEITLDQIRFLVSAVLLHEVFGADDFDVSLSYSPFSGLD